MASLLQHLCSKKTGVECLFFKFTRKDKWAAIRYKKGKIVQNQSAFHDVVTIVHYLLYDNYFVVSFLFLFFDQKKLMFPSPNTMYES